MFALHALWRADRTLALWGEDARPKALQDPAVTATADPGGARPHPYAASGPVLRELLSGVGPGLEWLVDKAPDATVTLLLPTLGDTDPQPSPELPGEPLRGPRPDLALTPWTVPAIAFDADAAAQLLGALYDPRHAALRTELADEGAVDVPYGASLRWLTAVHDLAWRLVGRGRVLPAMVADGDAWYARWTPAPTEDDWHLIRALAAACPAVCRAEHRLEHGVEDRAEHEAEHRANQRPDLGVEDGAEYRAQGEAGDRPVHGAERQTGFRPEQRAEHRAELQPGRGAERPVEDRTLDASVRQGAAPPTGTALVADLLDALVDREVRAALDGLPPLLPGGRPPRPPETTTERWLAALTTSTGALEPSPAGERPAEAEEFRAALAAWQASEAVPPRPLRVCFRLVEPLGPDPADLFGRTTDDNWRVDILLQAPDEPSLTVEAQRVWAAGPVLNVFARKQYRPQEALLTDLERASRTWPVLAETLREARPGTVHLDRAGAVAFLRDAAPRLAEAGFGVLLPTWWRNPPRVGLTLSARTRTPGVVTGGSVLDQDAVVAFEWRAALGDTELTATELRELATTTQPLVRFRGQWLEADTRAIAAAAAFIARDGTGTMAAGEVLRTAVDVGATAAGLPVYGVDADAWLGDLLAGAPAAARDGVPLPAWFGAELRPYQRRGVAWLAYLSRLGVGAVLADDMGLGKTVQALALLAAEHGEDAVGPTLVVCPMSLVGNWLRETERFAPRLRVHVHHGADRHTDEAFRNAAEAVDVVITTYETAHRDAAALRKVAWRRVVADEAQQIKNIATRQSQAIRALPARHRIALTGTPVENRLAELHSVLDFANPGLFGDAESFKAKYAIAIERNGSTHALAALRRVTAPFVLRRHKTDPAIAAELPAKQEMTVLCTLTPEQAGLYRAVVADMEHRIAHTAGIERQGLILATLGKLKQICNHPAQFLKEQGTPLAGRSGKVERLVAILEEALGAGDKALCFTQYARFGELLHAHLAERLGVEVLFLHGGVTGRRRDEIVRRFQSADGPTVFVLSLKAGGTGLNLTAAGQVIHVDRWWNPAVEDQATDRAYRIGREQLVQVRKFVCVGTVEERIDALIAGKRSLAASVVGAAGGGYPDGPDLAGAGEPWLTDLSAAALRELVALAEEAEA